MPETTTLQPAFKTFFQGMDEFNTLSVAIDEWGLLDGPRDLGPFCVIETADDFEWVQASGRSIAITVVRTHLIVEFTTWEESRKEIGILRDAVRAKLDSGTGWAMGLEGVSVNKVTATDPIEGIYYADNDEDLSFPVFLKQMLDWEVEEF